MGCEVKILLSLLLSVSAFLLLSPQINTYSQIPDDRLAHDAKNQLAEQIAGFSVLFFVGFCALWSIPGISKEDI